MAVAAAPPKYRAAKPSGRRLQSAAIYRLFMGAQAAIAPQRRGKAPGNPQGNQSARILAVGLG
jgi:hypothetical protein